MLNVLCETAYPVSVPSSRVRVASFAPFLRSHGVSVQHCPRLSEHEYSVVSSDASVPRKAAVMAHAALRAATSRQPPHDLLLIQKLGFLSPLPGLDPPRKLDVYDFDDAMYLDGELTSQRLVWAKQQARRYVVYLRRSRLVIAGNPLLAEHARQYARRVEVVPSCVDPTRQPIHTHRDADYVTVGWIGSRTTSKYLHPVLPVFERLNAHRLRAKLVLIGADRAIDAPWVEHRSWSLETQNGDIASFDIGIMPLPDTEWARGKCGYKVLQYFAAAVPAVASPVGVATELIGRDRGILAMTTDDWQAALDTLLADVAERRERGAAARAFAERNYSYQRWSPELAGMLRSVT